MAADPHPVSVYRKGIVGDWKNELTPEQVAQVVAKVGGTMARLGYEAS